MLIVHLFTPETTSRVPSSRATNHVHHPRAAFNTSLTLHPNNTRPTTLHQNSIPSSLTIAFDKKTTTDPAGKDEPNTNNTKPGITRRKSGRQLEKMPPTNPANAQYKVDEKVLCFHGPMLYEAKILDTRVNEKREEVEYKVHYKGWKNT